MKSIMEEASTITKAIENAWIRANKPSEFKIRVFQEPETNFFGFSKKAAKIAFFFEEKKEERPRHKPHHKRPQPKTENTHTPKQREQRVIQPQPKQPAQPAKKRAPLWSPDLVQAAQTWLKGTLQTMGLPNIGFKTEVNGNNLIVKFASKITDSDAKEHQLFSSFAHLILVTLRHKFKTSFARARIIIKR